MTKLLAVVTNEPSPHAAVFALALSSHLAEIVDRKTILVDLNYSLLSGDISSMLNTPQRKDLNRLAGKVISSATVTEAIVQLPGSPLSYLLAPRNGVEPELLESATIGSIISVLMEDFDYIIVNLGSALTGSLAHDVIFPFADEILYVGQETRQGLDSQARWAAYVTSDVTYPHSRTKTVNFQLKRDAGSSTERALPTPAFPEILTIPFLGNLTIKTAMNFQEVGSLARAELLQPLWTELVSKIEQEEVKSYE